MTDRGNRSEEKKPDIVPRTYAFSLRIVRMCRAANFRGPDRVLLDQVLRSGTSIGANVEEAQGGHSKKDFIAKMQIAYKEARETGYWLRLIRDSDDLPTIKMSEIIVECGELTKILASIILASKRNS